jgi:signal transduction histidine kinase
MPTFTVDTHLFRELGELLVGRDSTALVELIKNSYDADARLVTVYGEALSNARRGYIRITDDGTGMSPEAFALGFLRIASRNKETGDRRSLVYGRRFTGAKGVGRLAAHKLARVLEVTSIPAAGETRSPRARTGVVARIDWNLVEDQETLEDVAASDAISVEPLLATPGSSPGTTITLRSLRRRWSTALHAQFLQELQAFDPPPALVSPLPPAVLPAPLLFERPLVRDVSAPAGTSFRVALEGDLTPPDDYWQAAVQAADWVIEIDASERSGQVRFGVAPTERVRDSLPTARTVRQSIAHPSPREGPFFQARILVRSGGPRDASQRAWLSRATGVRVFMEGFRVLPYGEPANDWLGLDRDYGARARDLLVRRPGDPLALLLPDADFVEEEGLQHFPNRNYYGAVFLTQEHSRSLRMLVNREGFVPEGGFLLLASLVRRGIDLATRTRAAATVPQREERRVTRRLARDEERKQGAPPDAMPTAAALRTAVQRATVFAREARELAVAGNIEDARTKVLQAVEHVSEVAAVSNDIIREGAMLRVLASIGTQLAAFVHEINGLLGMAESIDRALSRIRDSAEGNRNQRRELRDLQNSVIELRRNLERQASYLVDVLSPDARRRRSRQRFSERFAAASRLVEHTAQQRRITLVNEIPNELKSPPMFPAELTTVFSNLLTNAVKAAGLRGKIRATGTRRHDGTVVVRVENTGARVDPADGERWFRPFESTTSEVDPVLGQGLGLGLPITRSTLEEYGAAIQFSKPSRGFDTALELTFPE